MDVITLLQKAGLAGSRSEGRRNVEQGGVEVDGEKVTDIARTYTVAELYGLVHIGLCRRHGAAIRPADDQQFRNRRFCEQRGHGAGDAAGVGLWANGAAHFRADVP